MPATESAVADRPGAGRAPARSPHSSPGKTSLQLSSLESFLHGRELPYAEEGKCFLFFYSVALLPPPVSHAGWQLLPRSLFALFHQTDFKSFYLRVGSPAATSPVHS